MSQISRRMRVFRGQEARSGVVVPRGCGGAEWRCVYSFPATGHNDDKSEYDGKSTGIDSECSLLISMFLIRHNIRTSKLTYIRSHF